MRNDYTTPDVYDLIYAPFRADVGYVVRAARGPVLEVVCGSGRLLLPMLEAGVDADGVNRDRLQQLLPRPHAGGSGGRAGVARVEGLTR